MNRKYTIIHNMLILINVPIYIQGYEHMKLIYANVLTIILHIGSINIITHKMLVSPNAWLLF